nr:AEC family transporter [uncultured Merdimonas sp.]
MELSILLAEQIVVIFLMMAIGYFIVKIGLFRPDDSKVLSNLVVYICFPCVLIDAFQIELTVRAAKGLILAVIAAVAAHAFMLLVVKILERPLGLNSIEKVSIIYTNAGYLVIPLVTAVLGEEWVFYTTAFLLVQNVMIWTHGVSVLKGSSQQDIKKIFLSPNIIALAVALLLFLAGIRLPIVLASCVESMSSLVTPASMLVIGMVIGDVDLKWVFRQKRPYLICLIRLVVIPVTAAAGLGIVERMGFHADAEYILLIVLIAVAAPVAAIITQLAQIYDKDVKYASVINVMSVVFCILTMPLAVLIYEMIL